MAVFDLDPSPAQIYLGNVSLTAPSIDLTTVDAWKTSFEQRILIKLSYKAIFVNLEPDPSDDPCGKNEPVSGNLIV